MTPAHDSDVFRQALIDALPRLKRFAIVCCQNEDDADDLVQMTVERGLTRWQQWSGRGEVCFWLFRILRNLWLDGGRKRVKMPSVELQPEHWVTSSTATESLSEFSEIADLVANMPIGQREVILLVCVEGYSYKQAAELLEIPIGTLMSRLARGRASLLDRTEVVSDD